MNSELPTESELKSQHLEEFESKNINHLNGWNSQENKFKHKSHRKAKNKIAKASKKRNRR